jgi:hypothetical protein
VRERGGRKGRENGRYMCVYIIYIYIYIYIILFFNIKNEGRWPYFPIVFLSLNVACQRKEETKGRQADKVKHIRHTRRGEEGERKKKGMEGRDDGPPHHSHTTHFSTNNPDNQDTHYEQSSQPEDI